MTPLTSARSVPAARKALFLAILLSASVFGAKTASAQPAAPVQIAPNGPTTNPNPDYVWYPATGANYYYVWVGDGLTNVAAGLYPKGQVCPPEFGGLCAINLAKNLSAGVNYSWQVQAKSGSGPGGTWSAGLNFTVQAPPAPTQIAPSGGIGSPQPVYTWNTSSGATQYYVQVSNGAALVFQGLYDTAAVCAGSTCAVAQSPALPAGPYSWQVQAKNAAGGTWSVGMNFTVQAPPGPTLVAPSGNISTPTPTYTWNTSSGATQYYVQVSNGATLVFQGLYDTATVCTGSTCAVAQSPALPAGPYSWQVQAKNAAGGTWSAGMNFTVQAPPGPTLVAPSGNISTPTPTYTWNTSSGATQYFVQVSNGATLVFQGLYDTATVCAGSTCAVAQSPALPAGPYSWQVQAKNAAGGTWSVGMNFTVQGPPAPVLGSPSGAIGNPTPTYTWNTSSGATQYWITVSNGTAPVFQGLYDTATVCSGSSCAVSQYPVLAIGSYTWAVQAKNAAGGTFSPDMTFSVQAPPAPALSSPSGGVSTTTPTFTWSASSGPTAATSYLLQVLNGSGGNVYQLTYTPAQASCAATCSVTPTTALTAGSYSWSVKATNAAGITWSSSLSFAFGSGPAPPTLVSPNGPMTSVSPTFVWNVSPGATEYWIDVRNASNVAKYQALLTASTTCGAQCQVTPFGLNLPAGVYTWAVQAKNTAGTNWSATSAFTVAGCGGEVKTGDFNGDGRTDRLCAGPSGIFVSLATGTGFTTATPWLSQGFGNVLVADFNSDGLTDIAKYDSTTAVYSVALSNGTNGFGALQPWGTANTPQIPQACAGISAKADVGDFNGDGRPDVSCKLSGSPSVFVGISNGSSFTFSTFITTPSATPENRPGRSTSTATERATGIA